MIAVGMRKVARQRREVLVDQRELEGHGARIGFIREQQVGHGVRFEVRHISAAIGERAVADFQNGFEQDRVRIRVPPACPAGIAKRNTARSMRRPMSRNRHAWPRVIESEASPANAASVTTRLSSSSRTPDAGSVGPALKLKTCAINFLQDAPGSPWKSCRAELSPGGEDWRRCPAVPRLLLCRASTSMNSRSSSAPVERIGLLRQAEART